MTTRGNPKSPQPIGLDVLRFTGLSLVLHAGGADDVPDSAATLAKRPAFGCEPTFLRLGRRGVHLPASRLHGREFYGGNSY